MLERSSIGMFILALSIAFSSEKAMADAMDFVTYPDSLSRQFTGVSIRTNLLWDGVAEPNIGLEVPVGDHVSVGANAGLKAWPRWLAWDWDQEKEAHWRNFAVVPEVRYYLDQIYEGLFFGADFVYTHYNVGAIKIPLYPQVEKERLQGSFWGGGLFVGYAWWPWQHWRLELEAGAAAGLAAYDRYDCAHCGTKLGEERKPAVVPKLGVNIAYNPVSREETKRRREARRVVHSGTDTLTVLTPPVAFVVHLKDVPSPETAGDRLARDNSWVIPIEKHRPLDYLAKPGRDSLLTVQFPVNSAVLDRSYANNDATLGQIAEAIRAICADERSNEVLISVVGLASIEGPQEQNDSLSARRARAAMEELKAATGVGRHFFEVVGKGEAWDWFRDQVSARPEGFSEEELEQLRSILLMADPDQREKVLRANAPLYKKVNHSLLEYQRNAGYIRVYYGVAPDPATQKLNGPVMDLLKAKRYREAVKTIEADAAVLARAQSHPEAMNAYGVAKYFTALEDGNATAESQALELLRRAAAQGSECAEQNLKGAQVYGPARKEYEAWLYEMNNNK